MSPTIRVDDEVYRALQRKAHAFVDSPNDVLRRLLGLNVRRQFAQRPTKAPNFVKKFDIQRFRMNGRHLARTTGQAVADAVGVNTGAASAWVILRQPENQRRVRDANIIAVLPDREVALADLLAQGG